MPFVEADNSECRKELIVSLYEGDLSASEEESADLHLKSCRQCTEYLNSLKLVSTSLEIFLEDERLQIPDDFSKRVTAAAESNVREVRSKKERSYAVLIVAGLLLISAFAVAMDAASAEPLIPKMFGQILAVGGLFGHFFYTASKGVAVVLGTVCSKLLSGSVIAILAVLTILFTSIYVFSKHMTHFERS